MIRTINTNTNPQPTFGVQGSTVPIYTSHGKVVHVTFPVQIVGLVPLICIEQSPGSPFSRCDCREWTNDDCYINPVFASSTDSNYLKNDNNMFLLEFPWYYLWQYTPTNSVFSIEEWNGSQWIETTKLIDNTYGTLYQFGNLCVFNWKGFDINWRLILLAFGEGFYRFRITFDFFSQAGSLVSEPFCLKEWSCSATKGTVRWESTINGGRIGSITDDKRVFEFCCNRDILNNYYPDQTPVIWYDQVRVYGFFGKEKTEYERVNIEYNNGEVIQVRNEAIQKFEYESALQPKWVHDRLKAYALMADQLYVTDYNWNNSDYEIDKKRVVCDGSYEPEYNINTRFSNVKVQFKEGFQNVIRDKCCSVINRRAST